MLDMGFKPQVDRIIARVPRRRQTMFFSATLDNEVVVRPRLLRRAGPLRCAAPAGSRRGAGRASLRPGRVREQGRDPRRVFRGERGQALVFVRTRRGADRLAVMLAASAFRPWGCTAT